MKPNPRKVGSPGISFAMPATVLATAIAITLPGKVGWAADTPAKPAATAPAAAAPAAAASAKPAAAASAPASTPAQTPASAPLPSDPFTALLQAEIQLGRTDEDNGNLRSAAYHYEMVSNLGTGPTKTDYAKKAAALRQDAKTKADAAFKDGMAAYEKNQIGPAFRSLLRALSYDPTNQVALRKIKDELIGTSVIPYTVQAGDTLDSIAQKNKYEDPSLAWVIGTYNDLGDKPNFKPGQVLKIPVMIGVLPKAVVAKGGQQDQEDTEYDNNSTTLAQARDLLNSNKFEDASKLAAKVLAEDPVNKDAKEVANASNYGLGKRLQDEKKYEAALTAFGRVDPNYKDTKQQMTAVRGQVVSSADDHYAAGVRYYTNDDLDNAIKEFETTLALNPNHPSAAKDLAQAKETRDKLRKLK